MATRSAFAVNKSFKGLLSEGTRSELREDHQVPKGKRCMRAYFLACFSGGVGLLSDVEEGSGKSRRESTSVGTE